MGCVSSKTHKLIVWAPCPARQKCVAAQVVLQFNVPHASTSCFLATRARSLSELLANERHGQPQVGHRAERTRGAGPRLRPIRAQVSTALPARESIQLAARANPPSAVFLLPPLRLCRKLAARQRKLRQSGGWSPTDYAMMCSISRLHIAAHLINDDTIANPFECYRLLLATANWPPHGCGRGSQSGLPPSWPAPGERRLRLRHTLELVELDWLGNPSDSLDIQDIRAGQGSTRRAECSCPELSIDELRRIRLARMASIGRVAEGQSANDNNNPRGDLRPALELVAADWSQLREFNCYLTRRRLVESLGLARRLGKASRARLQPIALYELERLAQEANDNLAACLRERATGEWLRLVELTSASLDSEPRPFREGQLRRPLDGGLPIGARTLKLGACSRAGSVEVSSDSEDSGVLSLVSDQATVGSSDGTAPFKAQDSRRDHPERLERLLRHRSSKQFQLIIDYSYELFAELLASSPLLKLELATGSQMSLTQLQVFACVECQKLRAALRFDWLPHCLWLAFDREDVEDLPDGRRQAERASVPADERDAHWVALGHLLGYLLREHLLDAALDLWLAAVERQLEDSHYPDGQPALLIPVELVVGGDSPTAAATRQVDTSRPEEALKRTLGRVLDELVESCTSLPSLEQQLQSSHPDEAGGGQAEQSLRVLWSGDDLVAVKRRRLIELVDDKSRDWIHADYLELTELVNKFHDNQFELASAQFDVPELSALTAPRAAVGEQVSALFATCRQVKLLDHLEQKLSSKMSRHFDFGSLVRLDLSPMARELELILQRERSLLVRLQADELVKLMDSLRLRLNELELSIDFDSALEDYLEERWQIKQSRAPDLNTQLLLAGNDDDDIVDQVAAEQLVDQQHKSAQTSLGQSTADCGQRQACANPGERVEDEDEFVNALVSNANPNVAHLLALSNPNGTPLGDFMSGGGAGELGVGFRGVAPLVETRLLLGRYEYFTKFFELELKQMESDSHFVLSYGLLFLTEYLPRLSGVQPDASWARAQVHLEASQLELMGELMTRRREFAHMLVDSHRRLGRALSKLRQSHKMRSHALNRLSLEFDLLMAQLCLKRLRDFSASDDEREAQRFGFGGGNIKHLDTIQENSSWSQKLEQRLCFLECQNDLLAREARLLDRCDQLDKQLVDQLDDSKATGVTATPSSVECDGATESRAQLLAKWRQLSKLEARLWRLVDQFETQLVKWLNSESKKLDYERVESSFRNEYSLKLSQLFEELASSDLRSRAETKRQLELLEENLNELRTKFNEFELKLLPIFKFFTCKHLTREHWRKLNQFLGSRRRRESAESGLQLGVQEDDKAYTTVAQLVELNAVEFIDELERMRRRASVEHELNCLIEAETRRLVHGAHSLKSQLESLEVCARLDEWAEGELALAAHRFIQSSLEANKQANSETARRQIGQVAGQLVACHATVRRYLKLSGCLNLIEASAGWRPKGANKRAEPSKSRGPIVLRSNNTLLGTAQQVRASLLIELLHLFASTWTQLSAQLSARLARLRSKLDSTRAHLGDIDELLGQVRALRETDLLTAGRSSQASLAQLERDSIELELRRELLATNEALALDRQRQAVRARDTCVRQISERAIPALRAATKALDCLGDGSSLRALRSYRPRPPLAIRLVIEAVCLLRNICCPPAAAAAAAAAPDEPRTRAAPTQARGHAPFPTTPQRRFDALRGLMVEDYWPVAWRTLNGVHSSEFVRDLRQVSKRAIPRDVIRLIRRRYLSRAEFQLTSIEQISRETGLLARWLVAVDVFDRVLNIVRPNYEAYLRSEEKLSELLAEVAHKRQQIGLIGHQLERTQEQIRRQVTRRTKLSDLAEGCEQQSRQLQGTRGELSERARDLEARIAKLELALGKLVERCLWKSVRWVYLDALAADKRRPLERVLKRATRARAQVGDLTSGA